MAHWTIGGKVRNKNWSVLSSTRFEQERRASDIKRIFCSALLHDKVERIADGGLRYDRAVYRRALPGLSSVTSISLPGMVLRVHFQYRITPKGHIL